MPITSRAPQPDVPPAPVEGEPERHPSRGAPDEPVPRSVGIVFVHGIGAQGPSETFLDWSGPIVHLLRAWRPGAGAPGDPVVRAAFDFSPTTSPLLEIAVPAAAGLPPSRWLITEAWWAADLRAPSLATVTAYLRSRLRTIVAGITGGYATRESMWVARRRAGGGGEQPSRWGWIEWLDRLQARAFSLGILVAPLSAAGSLALAFYSLLRRIPIGPVREFAELRIIDSFLVDWFGDLPVLLDDPVQVANVRARVAGAIDRLRAAGADAIVLVAHSGGAIVAFETLLDPTYADRPVDKLITLGQGLSLGWRLEADPGSPDAAIPAGDRLLGDLGAARPSLRWVDVWASYDPAPAGPIRPVPGVPLDVVDAPDVDAVRARLAAAGSPAPAVVESRPVTNRMSVLDDHGTYWQNDEGFLVPLVRHVDAARGPAAASRFYRDPGLRADRIERRRERVAVLAAWDWLVALTAVAALLVLVVMSALGGNVLAAAGDAFAGVFAMVPGHEVIAGPVDAYGRLAGGLCDAAGLAALANGLGRLGPPLLGAVLVAALYLVLAAFGNGRWDAWDRRERAAVRPEVPVFPSRREAAGEAVALISGLVALLLATAGAPFGLGWLPVAVLALGGWAAGVVVAVSART
ncbi:MAG TPA: hypothetical protein VFS32_12575 [Candidatus Limnocylindrales bacterium]|nr:hypothetical protein [Candidatus Limnocylindrales bacterium]